LLYVFALIFCEIELSRAEKFLQNGQVRICLSKAFCVHYCCPYLGLALVYHESACCAKSSPCSHVSLEFACVSECAHSPNNQTVFIPLEISGIPQQAPVDGPYYFQHPLPGGAASAPSKSHHYGQSNYDGGAADLRLPIFNITLPDRPPIIPIPKPTFAAVDRPNWLTPTEDEVHVD
jgi:hypothetical protein